MVNRDHLHVEETLCLSTAAGSKLEQSELARHLALLSPEIGLMECCRVARLLGRGAADTVQIAGARAGLSLFNRGKDKYTTKVFGRSPHLFHEHLLRVLVLHFLARIEKLPIVVPDRQDIPVQFVELLGLVAMGLNDYIGLEHADEEEASRRHLSWMLAAAQLNERPDLHGRFGKAWMLLQALLRHSPGLAEDLELQQHLEHLVWIVSFFLNFEDNNVGNLDRSVFSSAPADRYAAVSQLLLDLSLDPEEAKAAVASPLHTSRISVFDEKPLVRLGNDQFILASPASLLNQFDAGLRAFFEKRISNVGRLDDAWGHAMEDVLLGSLSDALERLPPKRRPTCERTKVRDLVVAGKKAVAVFELKCPQYRRQRLELNGEVLPSDWIDAILIGSGEGKKRKKGALDQVRDHVQSWKDGALTVKGTVVNAGKIFPIIVIGVRLHRLVLQRRLDELSSDRSIWPWPDIRPLVLPLQELEALISLTEGGMNFWDVAAEIANRGNPRSLQFMVSTRGLSLAPQVFRKQSDAVFKAAVAASASAVPLSQ